MKKGKFNFREAYERMDVIKTASQKLRRAWRTTRSAKTSPMRKRESVKPFTVKWTSSK